MERLTIHGNLCEEHAALADAARRIGCTVRMNRKGTDGWATTIERAEQPQPEATEELDIERRRREIRCRCMD